MGRQIEEEQEGRVGLPHVSLGGDTLSSERPFCNVPAESFFSGLDSPLDPESQIKGMQVIGPLIYQTSRKVAALQSVPLNDRSTASCPLLSLLSRATKSQGHRRTSSLLWNCLSGNKKPGRCKNTKLLGRSLLSLLCHCLFYLQHGCGHQVVVCFSINSNKSRRRWVY